MNSEAKLSGQLNEWKEKYLPSLLAESALMSFLQTTWGRRWRGKKLVKEELAYLKLKK